MANPELIHGSVPQLAPRAAAGGLTMTLVDPPGRPSTRARWYGLQLQPTLLGGTDLVRRWGRLGTTARHPQRRAEHYADLEDAIGGLSQAVERRLRRGYLPASRGVRRWLSRRPRVTYWPGGTRAGSTSAARRPRNPRETRGAISFSFLIRVHPTR
jgi:predicted DNA-binding WGR domain protein